MKCDTCGIEVEPVVVFGYNAAGHKKVFLKCPNKARYEHSVQKKFAGGVKIEDYDTDNMVISFDDRVPCDIPGCKNMGAENHHFAPEHLFGEDCEKYPQMNLCKPHHDEWHRLTNTGVFYKERVKPEYQIKSKRQK